MNQQKFVTPPKADRYAELPAATRAFLEHLDDGDLKLLITIIQSARSIKWVAAVLGALLGLFILVVQAIDALKRMWH